MGIVNTHEAKTNLSRLIDEVRQGAEIVIARANRPVARLVPFGGEKQPRRPGYLKGKVRVAADFDAPLPPASAITTRIRSTGFFWRRRSPNRFIS